MTSPLFGENQLLSSFVEGIGRNLFVYRGHEVFEGVLACFLSLNVRREENNFVYAPQMPEHIVEMMSQSSVRFTTSLKADNIDIIFNEDFNEAACMHLDPENMMFLGQGANKQGEVAIAYSRQLPINSIFIDHISAKIGTCGPFSPSLLLAGRYKALVTTDWRWRAMAGMVGVPSVLLSGPRYPSWINKLPGYQIDTLVDKTSSLKACRCARTTLCHARAVEAKPCMTMASWHDLKGVISNLLENA